MLRNFIYLVNGIISQIPLQSKRFIDYAPTSLERNYKYELLTEHDLGVHVDLILPEAYEKPEEQVGTPNYTH